MQTYYMLGACQASTKIADNFRQVYNVLRRRDLLLSVSVTSTLTECPGQTSLSGLSSTLAGEGSGGIMYAVPITCSGPMPPVKKYKYVFGPIDAGKLAMHLPALKYFSHYSLSRRDSLGLGTPTLDLVGISPSRPVDLVAGVGVPSLPSGLSLSEEDIEKRLHMYRHGKS